MTFLDVRGNAFDGGYSEGNIALGARAMLPSGYNFGMWGGYDVRRSGVTGNVFQQLSGGLELLGDRYAFRANGYLPLSGAMSGNGTARVFLSGNDILMSGGQEVPLHGVDAEAGMRFYASGEPAAAKQELWAYGGGFWFSNAGISRAIAGPKARIEWQINDVLASLPGSRLSFGAAASSDSVRGGRVEVGASLRIPIGGESRAPSSQWRRMADPIVRDTDIVVQGTTEHVADDITGAPFDHALTVADGDDLQAAIAAAGLNSLLIVNGDRIGSWTVGDSQTLLGGGGTIAVHGLATGTVADFTAAGTRPVLQDVQHDFSVTRRVLIANNNTHFAGLEVDSVGMPIPDDYPEIYYATAGIYGEGLDNVAITGSLLKTSVDFTNPGGGVYHPSAGAYFHLSNHVTIANNEFHVDGENSFGAVFSLETGDEGNVSNQMIDNTIYVSGAPAIAISMAGKDGLVRNNAVHLSGEGERGIILTNVDNSLADHNTIAIDAGASSIGFVFNSADNSTIDHNTVTTQDAAGGAQGVTVQLGSDSTISNNTFTMTGAGIYVSAGTDNLAIAGNTLTSKTGDGVRFADGSFRMSDNIFTGAIGGDVVRFTNSSATVLAGSNGNVIAAGTTIGDAICGGNHDFTGTWSITDNRATPGTLQTYTDTCNP